jgi:hypothetical protein
MAKNFIELTNFSYDGVAYAEAQGLANVWAAYAENCAGEYIMYVGFNEYTGFVFIALDNGISIVSSFGDEAEYLVSDINNGEEYFFTTYDEAIDNLDAIEYEED